MAYQEPYRAAADPRVATPMTPPPEDTTPAPATPYATTEVVAAPVTTSDFVATPVVPAPVTTAVFAATPVVAAPVADVPYMATPIVATPVAPTQVATTSFARTPATIRPSRDEMSRRITVFGFGIVQGLIIIRIVLLALDARAANGVVSFVLNLSQVAVAPFDGILRSNALGAHGSSLDLAAVAALIGWTVIEGLVIASIGLFRREPA